MGSPAYSSSLTYPGSVATQQTTVPGAGSYGGGGFIDPAMFKDLIAKREAERAQKIANEQEMQKMQLDAMRHQMAVSRPSGERAVSTGGYGGHGKPIFTKTVGGPGMTGGTIRLNQWEPGAAFAGYEEDLGGSPNAGYIQPPGPSAASLQGQPDLNRQVTGDRLAQQMALSSEGPLSPKNMQVARANQSNAEVAGRAGLEEDRQRAMIDQQRALMSLLSGGR